MLNAEQATAAARAIPYPSAGTVRREDRPAALREYRAAQDAVTSEFRAYLENTYPHFHSDQILQKLWDAAWSNGHASGYSEVEGHYSEYADLTLEELEELDY